jgi:hypothetical protein
MMGTRTRKLATGLLGLMAAGFSTVSQAQTTNFIVDQLDTDTSGTFVNLGWGTAYPYITWDSTVNKTTALGPNNQGSGSALWSIDWSANPPNDQVMVNHRFPDSAVLDLVNYTNVSFDIWFDPTSATDGQGSYGAVELDWTPQSEGWPSTTAGTAFFYTTNSGWVHAEIPVVAAGIPKLSAVTYLGFKIQQSRTGAPLTGISTFRMDNIILHARAAELPGPKMSVKPVTTPPGLTVVASGGGNGYIRGMIRTLDPNMGAPYYSWLGQGSTPVTYSMTITNYPKTYYYFQSQIFLVPNGDNQSSVDYFSPTVMALDIRNLPDGTATGALRYKTNHVNANASDYVPAVLVCSNGVLGTWSLTFLQETNVTVTAPNGASTNFTIPEADALEFYNPLSVYFGNQQNGDANAGQSSTYSRVKVTGVTLSPEIDETFSGPDLNPDPLAAKWKVVCDLPSCVFIMRPDHKYWVNWTVPDTGFSLQTSPTMASGSWVADPQLTNVINTATENRMLIPQSSLPTAQQGFFRLIKPGT